LSDAQDSGTLTNPYAAGGSSAERDQPRGVDPGGAASLGREAATATFFGTAIVVSFLIEALIR